MFLPDRVVRSRRVITPRGTRPAAVHIRRGRILGVLDYDDVLPGSPIDDIDGVVMPGVIDAHVHADDVDSAARTAAATGVTTIVVAAQSKPRADGVDVEVWAEPAGVHCAVVSEEAMPHAAKLDATLLVHPVLPRRWFERKAGEGEAVTKLVDLVRKHRVRTHVHLSSWEALTPLFLAQQAHVPITAEVSADALLRPGKNREYLWAALANGLLRVIVGGRLPDVWNEARVRGYTLEQIVEWMCRAPAQLAGLTRKGKLDAGFDADLVVFDPDACVVERTIRRGVDAAS